MTEVLFAWPPECCVPAFVHAAIIKFGIECPYPAVIPGILGVKVHAGQQNPLGLKLVNDEQPSGITAADADREINIFLAELGGKLAFERVPFSTIVFGMWEEFLELALARDIVVGVGVDYEVLIGKPLKFPAQHIVRILEKNKEQLVLWDDSGETDPPQLLTSTDIVRDAVYAISEGFWMIGPAFSLKAVKTDLWSNTSD